jgi:hypothetical protein
MQLEPIIYLLWSELTHRLADEFPTPSILGCEYFLVSNTGCHIAPATS